MKLLPRLLFLAALGVMITGIGLAIAQPGSLGDDDSDSSAGPGTSVVDDDGSPTSQPRATVTTPTSNASSNGDVPSDVPSDVPGDDPTIDGDTGGGDPTATSAPSGGSGLGSSGAGQSGGDDLANTGAESMILLALGLAAAGVLTHRATAA